MTGFALGQRPQARECGDLEGFPRTPEELTQVAGDTPWTVWLSDRGEVWPMGEQTTTLAAFMEYIETGDVAAVAPNAVSGTIAYGFLACENVPALHGLVAGAAAAAGRSWAPDQPARLYAGPPGSSSGLHWDGRSASLVHLFGDKEAVLFAPSATDRLGPFPNTNGPNASLDPFEADERAMPPHIRYDITPGTVLDIPYGWWHAIRSLTPSLSITLW